MRTRRPHILPLAVVRDREACLDGGRRACLAPPPPASFPRLHERERRASTRTGAGSVADELGGAVGVAPAYVPAAVRAAAAVAAAAVLQPVLRIVQTPAPVAVVHIDALVPQAARASEQGLIAGPHTAPLGRRDRPCPREELDLLTDQNDPNSESSHYSDDDDGGGGDLGSLHTFRACSDPGYYAEFSEQAIRYVSSY